MFWTHQNVTRIVLDFVIKVHPQHQQSNNIHGKDFYLDFGLSSMQLVELGVLINSFFHFFDTKNPPNLLTDSKLDSWVHKILDVRAEKDVHLSFQSSGTSGNSKLITHSINSINREIEFLHLQIKPPKRVVAFVPSNHIYGFLFTIVLPEVWNTPVINSNAIHFFDFSTDDLIIATPFNWDFIYKSLNNKKLYCSGISSGAPLNAHLYSQLSSIGFHIIEVYGTTETAGIGYRDQPLKSFKLFPYWSFDSELKNLLRSYDQKIFPLLDHIVLHNDSTFSVQSRIDQVIQIGGVNISLENICVKIRSIDVVHKIDVYAKASGSNLLIGATIQLNNNNDETKANCLKWMNQILDPIEMPSMITFIQ